MDIQKDFADLCSLLNARGVEFLIVGGYAVAFHGAPRFTGDLDILVRPDAKQVEAMLSGLIEFGFPAEDIPANYLLDWKKILQLGRIPIQIHIMTNISGVNWETAWDSREQGAYGGIPVFYLGRDATIANKLAAGRAKDLADVEALSPSRSDKR